MCRIHGLIPETLRGGSEVEHHRCGIIKAEIEVRNVGGAVYVFGNELCLFV